MRCTCAHAARRSAVLAVGTYIGLCIGGSAFAQSGDNVPQLSSNPPDWAWVEAKQADF